jgi:hypothetical protein
MRLRELSNYGQVLIGHSAGACSAGVQLELIYQCIYLLSILSLSNLTAETHYNCVNLTDGGPGG